MVFEVKNSSGTYVDLLPYIMTGGISWKRGYVDGGNEMTMQDGKRLIDRVAVKGQWSIAFKPLTAADQATLLGLLDAASVMLHYTDPETNTAKYGEFYVSELPSSYLIRRTDGTEYWGGLTATFDAR